MDLVSDLQMALAVARLRSISAVAREMNMTASSVSRRLDDLERKLDVRIFNRTTKGLFLTDDGADILAQGRDLVEKAEQLLSRATGAGGQLSGTLKITAPARFGQLYVAPLAAEFLLKHPNVSVDLACTDQIQNLEETGMDVAIRIGRFGQEQNLVRKLTANRRVLVAAPRWIEKNGAPAEIDQLNKIDGLFLGDETVWRLKGPDGVEVRAKPFARFRSRYGDVVRQVCEAGAGVAFKSLWDVSSAIEDGSLVRILPDYDQFNPSDITLVLPTRRYVNNRVRTFVEMLEEMIQRTFHTDGPT